MEPGGQEITVQSAKNFRALRRMGVSVRKTIDKMIATRCIESEYDNDLEKGLLSPTQIATTSLLSRRYLSRELWISQIASLGIVLGCNRERMKHSDTIWLAFVGCLNAAILMAQEETFVPASDVSFTISTDRANYERRQSITVKYRIVNISNAPVYVPRAWEEKCPTKPHVWAWFENGAGKHFVPGYGGSCSPVGEPHSVAERMAKEAVLLKPGDHLDGALELDPTMFGGGLPPGPYRIEAVLSCWNEDEFSAAEKKELSSVAGRFVRGQASASAHITLRL